MREEITQPKHWRKETTRNNSWTTRRRAEERQPLPADLVDAAFAEEIETEEPNGSDVETLQSTDILNSLASQLTLLDAQREQIQRLLAQAKKS